LGLWNCRQSRASRNARISAVNSSMVGRMPDIVPDVRDTLPRTRRPHDGRDAQNRSFMKTLTARPMSATSSKVAVVPTT
jgi:hypothetical protein